MSFEKRIYRYGVYVSSFGVILSLLWIGVFKFTPTEAAAIKPLMINHPLTQWLYFVLSDQQVSNFIGVVEIVTAILIGLGYYQKSIAKVAAVLVMLTFITTLSFLITTPNVWRQVDGVLITDFFILKDILFLGFGLMLYGDPKE
ncbi:DUF417 family protein [Echinicola sediminis]